MFHSRITADFLPEPLVIHSQFCRCGQCGVRQDPMGFRRARRIVRIQAAVFTAFLAAIYGLVALNAAPIARSFGLWQ